MDMGANDKEPATKSQLKIVQSEISGKIGKVRSELGDRIDAVRTELGSRIDAVRSELGDRIDAVRTELGGRIETVRSELGDRIDAARTELKADFKRVSFEVVKIREEMATKKDVTEIVKDIVRGQLRPIMTLLDKISAGVFDNRRTLLVYDDILKENKARLGDHETRLTHLEAKP